MNKKRFFLLVIIFSFFVFFIVYFLKQEKTQKEKGSSLPAKPSIPNYTKGSFKIQSTITEAGFSFPEKLPLVLIEKTPAFTEEAVLKIATQAGFIDKNYIVADDVARGKTYIFKDGSRSLTIYTKASDIFYTDSVETSTSAVLPDETLISTAKGFLKDKFLSENENLFFSSIDYLREKEEGFAPTERGGANIFKINFAPIEAKIKFIETNPLGAIVSVWLNPVGEVFKAEIKMVSQARFSLETVAIKNFVEFTNTLSQSTIVSLDNGALFPSDLPEGSIETINVNHIEIAYYQGVGNQNFYQPVFVLGGDAQVKDYGSLPVTLYLPAVKGL